MNLDILAILKYLWGFLTFILLGVIKHLYSEFQTMKGKIESLEKQFIELKSSSVTKDDLDNILDRKMKPLQDNLQGVRETVGDLRGEVKGDVNGLRTDIQELVRAVLDKR